MNNSHVAFLILRQYIDQLKRAAYKRLKILFPGKYTYSANASHIIQ
jgi:hypothetical protein